jgi:hypothetical protein
VDQKFDSDEMIAGDNVNRCSHRGYTPMGIDPARV